MRSGPGSLSSRFFAFGDFEIAVARLFPGLHATGVHLLTRVSRLLADRFFTGNLPGSLSERSCALLSEGWCAMLADSVDAASSVHDASAWLFSGFLLERLRGMIGLLPGLLDCTAMTVAAAATATMRVAVLPVEKSNGRSCRQLYCDVRRPLCEEGGKAAVDCGQSVTTDEEVNSSVVPLVRLDSIELHRNPCFSAITD